MVHSGCSKYTNSYFVGAECALRADSKVWFRYFKYYICTSEILNTAHLTPFLTTQYPFSNSLTQIQKDIVYWKTEFKCEFSRFLMYKYKLSTDLLKKSDKYIFKG